MRIVLGVAVLVMFEMELSIGLRMEKRGPLGDESEQVEEPFPKRIHPKHPVRHIAVQEEALREDARVPMSQEKADNDQHASPFVLKISVKLNSLTQDVVRHAPFGTILVAKELRASQEEQTPSPHPLFTLSRTVNGVEDLFYCVLVLVHVV